MTKRPQFNDSFTGNRIKELREEQGFNQEAFSKILNIDRSVLSRYETGSRSIPLDIIVRIAQELKTSTDYLLGLTNSKSSKIKEKEICDYIGLTDKSISILKVAKNLEIINVINFLIEQEEIILCGGFTPIISKKCSINKIKRDIKHSYHAYEQDMAEIKNTCIPILSLIHHYLEVQPTNENIYIIDNSLKKQNDLDYLDTFLSDETVSTKELIEDTFLNKIKSQLEKAKNKYLGGKNSK